VFGYKALIERTNKMQLCGRIYYSNGSAIAAAGNQKRM